MVTCNTNEKRTKSNRSSNDQSMHTTWRAEEQHECTTQWLVYSGEKSQAIRPRLVPVDRKFGC